MKLIIKTNKYAQMVFMCLGLLIVLFGLIEHDGFVLLLMLQYLVGVTQLFFAVVLSFVRFSFFAEFKKYWLVVFLYMLASSLFLILKVDIRILELLFGMVLPWSIAIYHTYLSWNLEIETDNDFLNLN